MCSPQLGWRPSYVHPKKHDMTERGAQVAPRARPIDGAGSQRARPIDGAGSPRARPSTESRARKHGTARKQTQRSVEPTLETSRQASRQRHREIVFILLEAGADRTARDKQGARRPSSHSSLRPARDLRDRHLRPTPRCWQEGDVFCGCDLSYYVCGMRVRSLMMRVRSLSSACGHAERAARARVHASRVRHLDQPSCDVDGDRFPLPS